MKRFLSIFLAIVLVILQLPGEALAFEEQNLVITSSGIYEAEAGESISISIKLKNNSRYDWDTIYDIKGTLGNHSSEMLYVEGSTFDTISELESGSSSSLHFKVRVDELTEYGNYSLPLTITYDSDSYGQSPITTTINIRVKNDKTTPQVVVSMVDVLSNNIAAGESFGIAFHLENLGTGPARNLKVSLGGLSNNGFSLTQGVNSRTIQLLEGEQKSFAYFDLKASPQLTAGNHELVLKTSYRNIKNEIINEESSFFINISSTSSRSSNLIIENLTYPTGSIGQNQEASIRFNIKNQGQMDAKNIIIEAKSEDQSGLVPKTISTIKIDSLPKDATDEVNFKFLSTSEATTKNYPIEITVSYTDDYGEKSTFNQFVGVFVSASESDSTKGKPKLIIDRYSFEPQLVKAGENFEMTLSFYNTSSNKTVRNIKIFLTAEAGGSNPDGGGGGSSAFTPVDSSNTFYIDSIPPKGRVEKTITMFTIPDAIAKTHTITANFEYEDNEGTELKDIELIGVPVVQNSRLETGELSYYPEAMMGQPMPVSLEFYNTGKVTLYNMMVKIEGDFQTENGSYYVGNFASGSSEYFEGMVIPNEPGELKGEVVFTFEDSTGQEQELRKEFTLNVMDMPPMDEFPDDFYPPMDDMKPGGIKGILKSKWLWISLGTVGLIIGGLIFYKKKKRKKEMSFDE